MMQRRQRVMVVWFGDSQNTLSVKATFPESREEPFLCPLMAEKTQKEGQ